MQVYYNLDDNFVDVASVSIASIMANTHSKADIIVLYTNLTQ